MIPSIADRTEMTKGLKTTGWYTTRPLHIQEIIDRYPLYNTYRYNGKYVFLHAIDEEVGNSEVTCRVNILVEVNPGTVFFNRRVFGVKLEDLEDLGISDPWNSSQSLDGSNKKA